MTKQKKTSFEENVEELDSILNALKTNNLNVKDLTLQVKRAKEIYLACKTDLEEAKLIISEIKESN
jgi:exodeoxyribonuclease VII small subunit